MEALKRALEMSPPIYALKGCPMREEPLHLVPKHLRKEFEEILNVRIEGDLCPICRYRLKNEYNGNMRDFPLRRWIFPSGQGRYRCGTSRGSNNQTHRFL